MNKNFNTSSGWRYFKIIFTCTAVFAISFFFVPAAHAAVEISDGSVQALYHLEDTFDSSGNAHNLTSINEIIFSPGRLDGAANTGLGNTNKYLTVSSSLGLTLNGTATFAFWLKANEFPATNHQQMLLTGHDAGTSGEYAIYLSSEVGFGCPNDKVFVVSYGISNFAYCHSWNIGDWHHIITSYDGNTHVLRLYVDGSLVASGVGTKPAATVSDNQFQVFVFQNLISPSSALIDELVVTNTVMPTSTQAALYNNGNGAEVCVTVGCGTPTPTADMSSYNFLGLWDQADQTADRSGSSNNPTNHGTTPFSTTDFPGIGTAYGAQYENGDYMDLPSGVHNDGPLSFGAWVRLDSPLEPYNTRRNIFGYSNSRDGEQREAGAFYIRDPGNSQIYLNDFCRNSIGYSSIIVHVGDVGTEIQWHHVAISCAASNDTGDSYVYLDGVPYRMNESSEPAVTSVEGFTLGWNPTLYQQSWLGSIVQPWLLNDEVSSSSVQALYNNGAGSRIEIAPASPPVTITNLQQYESDGVTEIAEGAATIDPTVIFSGNFQWPLSTVGHIEVEVQPIGSSFTGTPTIVGENVIIPGSFPVTLTAAPTTLADGAYKWQARTSDISSNVTDWVEFGTPGNTDFEVRREPVVIVPGILGTKLSRVLDGEEVWPNTSKMPLSLSDDYLDDLKLDSSGNDIVNIATGDIFENAFIFFDVYNKLIQSFENAGYQRGKNLFIATYDWRKNPEGLTDALGTKIQEALTHSPTNKINIVAHSMGSIVTKEYLLQNPNASENIGNLIFVGSPNLGSPKAFKVLEYGDNFGFKVGKLEILNHEKIKNISQNMPSVYGFLPGREYFNRTEFGTYVLDARHGAGISFSYDQARDYLLQNSIHNQEMVAASDPFHQSFDTTPLPLASSTHFFNIVGCQSPISSPTIGRFRLYANEKYNIDPVNGDGTVPLISANSYPQARAYFVHGRTTDADHMGLIAKSAPLGLINKLAVGNTTSNFLGISEDGSVCDSPSKMQVISTHSPVTLHVYDEFGNHTGPTSTGDIEMGIPDSDYEIINHNNFVFVPSDRLYRVVIDATDHGTADLEMETYNNFLPEKKTTYLNIPLSGDQTNAEVLFNDASAAPAILALDSNGDNIIDQFIPPTAQLTASTSEDITPPALTMPAIPSLTLLNSSVTFTFSAADTESGIAYTLGMLDGAPISSGDTITMNQPGNHVFRLESKDLAGNPAVQELNFTVVYQFGGFLAPIKADGTGVYKLGRVLPVKFQLTDTNHNFVPTATAHLFMGKVLDGILGTGAEIVSTVSGADTGDLFRYDPETNAYIFNLSTNAMSSGTWWLRADLDDGKSYYVLISLKK
jgi:pimeloyl-ACP methyl ester carboxylesterase